MKLVSGTIALSFSFVMFMYLIETFSPYANNNIGLFVFPFTLLFFSIYFFVTYKQEKVKKVKGIKFEDSDYDR
ncbi:hypothetical protein [Heyndrickxia oleronia]|uniref:hypothetical protein n=1 Tax=Heyndrickxia oleronia TaxID=38875 RepID=UPI001C0EBEF2|nr:hypothetical protein [Heyndrickxia oleronia]MBU5210025.1 hypothetical protein [Heyndrickxia oleronia]